MFNLKEVGTVDNVCEAIETAIKNTNESDFITKKEALEMYRDQFDLICEAHDHNIDYTTETAKDLVDFACDEDINTAKHLIKVSNVGLGYTLLCSLSILGLIAYKEYCDYRRTKNLQNQINSLELQNKTLQKQINDLKK